MYYHEKSRNENKEKQLDVLVTISNQLTHIEILYLVHRFGFDRGYLLKLRKQYDLQSILDNEMRSIPL